MANCPECGNDVGDDFGLVNCSSCGSPVMVDMDGQVSSPESSASGTAALVEELVEEVVHSDLVEAPTEEVFEEEAPGLNLTAAGEQQLVEEHQEVEEFEAAEPVTEEVVEEAYEPLPPTDPSLEDVEAYANDEISQAREGHLRFNLRLVGIDSAETKNDLKDALTDSKLQLDPEATVAAIESGELLIEDLSAIKAAILVQRLKSLPVEISWEQYAIQQA